MGDTSAEVIEQDDVLMIALGFPKTTGFQFGVKQQIFNALMRTRRTQLQLTQAKLGKLVGIAGGEISKIEGFRKFPDNTLASKIARVLGVEQADLFPSWLEFYVLNKSSREFVCTTAQEVQGALVENPWTKSPLLLRDPLPADPQARTLLSERNRLIERAFDSLEPEEKLVISMRFNLDGGGYRTLVEAGVALGRSPERARQFEAKALEKLRKWRDTNTLNLAQDPREYNSTYWPIPVGSKLTGWAAMFQYEHSLRHHCKECAEEMDQFALTSPVIWQGNKVTTLVRWLLASTSIANAVFILSEVWSYLPISEKGAEKVIEQLKIAQRGGRKFRAVS